MQAIASAKFVRISPRKLRLIVSAVKHFAPSVALSKLSLSSKRGAKPVAKVLQSALSNAGQNKSVAQNAWQIKAITVNEGPKLKRFRPSARGRVRPFKKRGSHIQVVLYAEGEEKKEVVKVEKGEDVGAKG